MPKMLSNAGTRLSVMLFNNPHRAKQATNMRKTARNLRGMTGVRSGVEGELMMLPRIPRRFGVSSNKKNIFQKNSLICKRKEWLTIKMSRGMLRHSGL